MSSTSQKFPFQREIEINDNEQIQFSGHGEKNFLPIENEFGVKIQTREGFVQIKAHDELSLGSALSAFMRLRKMLQKGNREISPQMIPFILRGQGTSSSSNGEPTEVIDRAIDAPIILDRYDKPIYPRTPGQAVLVDSIHNNHITLATGPAGTGKTFIAMAMAVSYLKQKRVRKIILVRPAVESGENLGFLPGDLGEKIAPYMTPLYDAINMLLSPETVRSLTQNNEFEVAPLAYMRGRTLNNSFIILDEAQNTSVMQMKMFLTRVGVESKIVVAGDETQKDLPKNMISGLQHACEILKNIKGINHVPMGVADVVRHQIVRDIIEAYEDNSSHKEGKA